MKVGLGGISSRRRRLIGLFWAELYEWCRVYHRSSKLLHGWPLNFMASVVGGLCFLTQFIRSHGLLLSKAISWILSSKNVCLADLTDQGEVRLYVMATAATARYGNTRSCGQVWSCSDHARKQKSNYNTCIGYPPISITKNLGRWGLPTNATIRTCFVLGRLFVPAIDTEDTCFRLGPRYPEYQAHTSYDTQG